MRRMLMAVLACLIVSIGSPAHAGGSWLDIVDRESEGAGRSERFGAWAGVGATVTMRGDFGSGSNGPVRAGTVDVYIRREAANDGGMRIGKAIIRRGAGNLWIAETTFLVPSVPEGPYWIDVCSHGCNRFFGDLIGGYVYIAATPIRAKLASANRGLRQQVDYLGRQLAQRRAHKEHLEDAVRASEDHAESAVKRMLAAERRVTRADEQAADAEAEASLAQREMKQWQTVTLAVLAGVVIAALLGIAFHQRRRRRRILIPDTPQELLEASGRR